MPSFIDKLPERLRQFADPSLERDKRMLASKGLIPIPPKDLALVLFTLALDDDSELSEEASKSIITIPENVMETLLSESDTPPEFMHYIARTSSNYKYRQKILLNPTSSDITIAYLAENIQDPNLLDIISNNQQRMLRSESIFEALCTNQALSRSTLDRIISFISLYFERKGMDSPDILNKLSIDQDEQQQQDVEETDTLEAPAENEEEVQESFLDTVILTEDLTKELPEEEELKDAEKENLYTLVQKMNVAEKIKLAMLGNKEARVLLAREPVRIIVAAVVRNPRISESEIESISKSTSIDNDILRLIAGQRKWAKCYSVKIALVYNPKTPPQTGMSLLKYLLPKDLAHIAKSKNVPGLISGTARKMLQRKRK